MDIKLNLPLEQAFGGFINSKVKPKPGGQSRQEGREDMKTYSVQKPDEQDNGVFCGTKKECLEYIAKWYTPEEIDEANATAEYHGWQIAEIDDKDDYCFAVTTISGDDLK